MFFHILNSILLAVFREMSLGILTTNCLHVHKSIAMGHTAVNMSVTGFGSVSCWFVRIYSFKFEQHIFYVIKMKPDFVTRWVHCTSLTKLRKNYPGSSIGRSPDLQAVVKVSITAMGKWLLACQQMAILAEPTTVWHGLALVDVAIFLRNSRTNFNRVCVWRWVHCDLLKWTQDRNVSQGSSVGRAPDLQLGGRGFDPRSG